MTADVLLTMLTDGIWMVEDAERYALLVWIILEMADLQDELARLRWQHDYERCRLRRAFYLLN